MKTSIITSLWAVAAIHLCQCAQPSQAVFPTEFSNQNGNTGDIILADPDEIQQLFRPSAFAGQWQTPVEITGIAFRVADGAPAYSATVPSLQINLSTSARTPETMARSYLANKGADETTVYLHNNIFFSSPDTPPINPFGIQITFDKPFIYDPTKGSLLMDFISGGTSSYSGSALISSQLYHSLSSSPGAAVSPNNPLGAPNTVLPYALITEFSWTPIPEPSTIGLLVTGAAALLLTFGRSKNR